MQIKVLSVDKPQTVQKGNKSYQTMDVSFRNLESGKIMGKTLVSFSYPEVWKFFKEVELNSEVTVDNKKIGDYWQWVGVTSGVTAPEESKVESNMKPATKYASNYETPEDREWKQIRIGRQAVVNSAIAMLKGKDALSMESVLDAAAEIEKWVNRREVSVPLNQEIE